MLVICGDLALTIETTLGLSTMMRFGFVQTPALLRPFGLMDRVGAGASIQDLSRAIRAQFEKFDRERGAAQRSAFADRVD
ncbi:hypothetical protein [Flavisphingomonas formosensis]|uniref:hypothetical protein n=1 Tax=Flavisphingomonas formosensis TaxID=861534 RepID=UPI0012F93783|nr:hypothetical protein [Sphingomonas formosensis]